MFTTTLLLSLILLIGRQQSLKTNYQANQNQLGTEQQNAPVANQQAAVEDDLPF